MPYSGSNGLPDFSRRVGWRGKVSIMARSFIANPPVFVMVGRLYGEQDGKRYVTSTHPVNSRASSFVGQVAQFNLTSVEEAFF